MDFWHFSSEDCGTSGSYVRVGGQESMDWDFGGAKSGFCWHWGRGVFSWCHLPRVCYICRNHFWLMRNVNHQGWAILVQLSSTWVYPVGGVYVEVVPQLPLCGMSLFVSHPSSHPHRPFFLSLSYSPLLPPLFPNFTSPQGVWAPLYLEKKWCLFFCFFF